MNSSIHPDTAMGTISLNVKNLDRSLDFYQQGLGLSLQRRGDGVAYLGAGGEDLLKLVEQPDARRVHGTTGLYHFALLVPSRLQLAHSLKHIIETETPVQGFADHGVSEAIYLSDPDGNGIEIYRDLPRDRWPLVNGQLQMVTDPLDLDNLLSELNQNGGPRTDLHPGTVIGHVHLHVRDTTAAETFYADVLGFDVMQRFGRSASFLSAGGYHHHLGANTWAGVNAPPPPEDALGLRWYSINLPDDTALRSVVDRVRRAGITIQGSQEGLFLRDPSGNGIRLAAKY